MKVLSANPPSAPPDGAKPARKKQQLEDWMVLFPLAMLDPIIDDLTESWADEPYYAVKAVTFFGGPGKAIKPLRAAKGAVARGKTVLGHFPEYKRFGNNLNARTFNIPEAAWDKMSEAERWGANQKFLDRMISRGDEIILATPLDKVRPGSYFARELKYMGSKGYVPSADGTRLIKP